MNNHWITPGHETLVRLDASPRQGFRSTAPGGVGSDIVLESASIARAIGRHLGAMATVGP